jgi:hypothetical protein
MTMSEVINVLITYLAFDKYLRKMGQYCGSGETIYRLQNSL